MDECEQGTHDCDDADRAECVNSEGGYHCTCLYPYTGDGTFCTGQYSLLYSKSSTVECFEDKLSHL